MNRNRDASPYFDGRDAANPDPFPRWDKDAQVAWFAKDHELRWAARTVTPAAPALPTPDSGSDGELDTLIPDAVLNDGFDLPKLSGTDGVFPRDGSEEEKTQWLQRCFGVCRRAGVTQYERALDYEWLQVTREKTERDYRELWVENLDLKEKLNHVERLGLDALAEDLHQAAKTIIEREVTRQVAALEKRVTDSSAQITYEGTAIERLHGDSLSLRQRIGTLEQLNPIWVKIHTKQS